MAGDYNFSNFAKDYTSFTKVEGGFRIKIDDLLQKYKGSTKESIMTRIFQQLDVCDDWRDGYISFDRPDNMPENYAFREFGYEVMFRFFKKSGNSSNVSDIEEKIDVDKIHKGIGYDVTEDDFKEALGLIMHEYDNEITNKELLNKEKALNNLKDEYENIPEPVLNRYYLEGGTTINVLNNNEKEEYEIISNSADGTVKTIITDANGNDKQLILHFNSLQVGDYGDGLVTERCSFNDDGGLTSDIEEYSCGLEVKKLYENNSREFSYGKVKLTAIEGNISSIVVNFGLPNQTTFNVIYGGEKIVDIKNCDEQQVLSISGKTKENFIKFLNKEAILGKDFDLNVNCNQISLEILKENCMPEDCKKLIDELGQEGYVNNVDFSVVKQNDGSYVLTYLTNEIRDYNFDAKRIVYFPDGDKKIYECDSDKIYVTENGEKKEYNRREFMLQKLIDGDVRTARLCNSQFTPESSEFRPDTLNLGEEYKKRTGKELKMYEPDFNLCFISFNVENTNFARKLYKKSKRIDISDTEYKQKIGKHTYNVAIQENKLSVKKDGKEYFISAEGMNQNLVKLLYESNPAALYRMAEKGIKVIFEAPETGGDGEYIPEENAIYINPEASSKKLLQQRIAHEAGHSFYIAETPVNKELEEMFKKETAICDKQGTELDKLANEMGVGSAGVINPQRLRATDGNSDYCATNIYEFVAEAYCLLTTGHAKSEYTIVHGYPKTFELVKKMIAENGY